MARDSPGVTLIELSIVLVIVALLAAGVVLGRDLVHHALLRKLIGEERQFEAAMHSFKAKYGCMPGDCAMYNVFGPACGEASSDPDTGCDGNADGTLWINDSIAAGELLKAWHHLSLSGLVTGPYTGRGDPTGLGPAAVIGDNIPRSSFQGLGWNFLPCDDALWPGGDLQNALCLGGPTPLPKVIQDEPLLSFGDAASIDRMIDDGLPDGGRVRGTVAGLACGPQPYLEIAPAEAIGCNLTFFW